MADIYFYKSITGQVYNFRDDRVDSISGALPATAAPLMDGIAAVGTSIKYAREDHVHPADTNKVDKEAGKGLSTNDFTTAEKDKLAGIAAGAEVNVQSDWNVSDSSSDAYIKNKPTIPTETSQLTNDSNFVSDANYVHTDNNFTTTLKNKLNGIASGAEVNVQSDWNQTDTAADDYIKNKPSLLALGETSTTAYRGDRGKTAYTHATDSSRLTTATASGLYKVASTAQGHIASLTAVTKADITGLGIPAQDTTYSEATSSTYGLVKIGYTASGKNYPVQLSSGKMYVNVPWTDTTYSAGSNITLTGTVFSLTKANVTGALGYTPPTSDTNNAVTQTATTTDANYEVLFSATADNTTRTEGARKTSTLTYNPHNSYLYVDGRAEIGLATSTATRAIDVYSKSGLIQLYSSGNSDGNGNRGLWLGAHGTATSGKAIVYADTNNNILYNGGTFYGDVQLQSSSINIIQKLSDTSNYGSAIIWDKATPYTKAYKPQIGFHNTNEAICILPYETDSTPYGGDVGLYIRSSSYMKFAGNYVGRFTANPTTGQVVVTDGTTGGIKSSGFTIAKSVPSDAKFTDTTYSAGSNITLTGTVFSLTKANVTGALGYTPPTSDTTYSEATSSAYGLVKIGYTASGKNYPVQLSSGKMYVNVPWTDTTYSAGTGLSLSGTTFSNSGATGVKGNAETSYRTGNVNLTPANIGAKAVQTAVSDPTASGTSATFIATITQNAQGVITPTKKTVRSATASQSGLMSAADKEKLDRMNGMVNYRNYDNGAQSTITMTSEVCMVFFMRDAGRYGLYLCSYWTNTIVKIAGTQTSVTTEGNAKISKNANSSYIYLDNTTGSSLAVMIIGGYISDYEIP